MTFSQQKDIAEANCYIRGKTLDYERTWNNDIYRLNHVNYLPIKVNYI